MGLNWTRENKSRHTAGNSVSVERRAGGWGQRFNAYCQREWAVRVNGSYLVTAANNFRTFASSEAAKRAAEDAVLRQGI